MYRTPHDHFRYGRGHGERVRCLVRLGLAALAGRTGTVTDLSCGNGFVARSLCPHPLLGDLAPGHQLCGPVEETVRVVGRCDLFVIAETLEHLDDPDAVVRAVARVADAVLVSTPVGAWEDTNAEHYWAWDRAEVEGVFAAAGYAVAAYEEVDSTAYGEPYCYGNWLFKKPGAPGE
jgi:hypothetical protein